MVGIVLLTSLAALIQAGAVPQTSRTSDCAAVIAVAYVDARALCESEQQLAAAERADTDQVNRSRTMVAAADVYQRASAAVRDADLRARLLDRLAGIYDAKHLAEPGRMELVLRELVAARPADTAPLFRLARLQEERDQIEAAESTFMAAKQLHPEDAETYRQLAQFYSRRVAALTTAATRSEAARREPRPAAAPDASGIYTVGGILTPPAREGVPHYPETARLAGIEGVVMVEVVISEAGDVTDARVVRSIPFLDDAAIAAVKTWRFAPSVVNGRPVPVRMTVTVNFAK